MRKFFTIFLFIFNGFSVLSQSQITLTFVAKDSISQNLIALDSVFIANITIDCDTTLFDTVPSLILSATWPIGINDMYAAKHGSFVLKQNYPNPFERTTFVNIYRDYPGPINLMLFDALGKKLAAYHHNLEKGFHSFSLSASATKVLILEVFDEKNNRSIKIISAGEGSVTNSIQYLGHTNNPDEYSLKNANKSGFIIFLGNQLQFTAYASGYSERTITDKLTSTHIYYFNMTLLNSLTVSTAPVTDITQTTATTGGTVLSDGGSEVTSRGVCWSTTLNPTTAGSHTIDGSGTGPFVSYLTSLNGNTFYYVRAYATNSLGTAYGNQVTFTPAFPCGTSLTINHVAGAVAPVNKTVTYATVNSIPGEPSKCWITSNLGADHQATSVIDNTEPSAGWYWQFNRKQGYKHDGTLRTPNTTWITNINENADWLLINDPCALELGSGWRIPTKTEWENVDAAGNWTTADGPWNSPLKMHMAGALASTTGSVENKGVLAANWSSTQISNNWEHSYVFSFNVSQCAVYTSSKASAFSIRCFREGQNIPTLSTLSIVNITPTAAIGGGSIIDTNGSSVTARGVCWSTSSNPTIANTHTSNGSGTGTFTSNLTGLFPNTMYYVRAYATNSIGTAYGDEISFFTLSWNCGSSFSINHSAGEVAPVNKTVSYGTVTNIPGETSKCWITSNLGADHQATTVDDATEASAGWYWQFNKKQGYKHDGITRTPNTTWINSLNENSDWLLTNDPCTIELGSGWRIPAKTELDNIKTAGNWISWSDPWNSLLKIHAEGLLLPADGGLAFRGSGGDYYSSTQSTTNYGWYLGFNISSGTIIYGSHPKANAFGLRCLRISSSPSVTTTSASGIGQNTATSGGLVTSDGGVTVTARGVCWSISPNPTIAGSYTTDGTGTGSFLSSLTSLTANTLYYARAYATNSIGTAYGNEVSFTTDFPCGNSITVNHIAGTVSPVNKAVTYATVNSIPGEPAKCWITSNLGADHQATSSSDNTEASAGWYWQFNRKQGFKHDGTIRTPNTTWITNIYENSDWVVGTDPCTLTLGVGWRIPTKTEWENVDAAGNWTTADGPWNSLLKMHMAGRLNDINGTLDSRGSFGYFWSSVQIINVWEHSYILAFTVSQCDVYTNAKAMGKTLRCLREGQSTPILTTTEVTNISQTAAISGGNITFDGGTTVTARGVCWSTSPNPTVANSHTSDGSGTGLFISSLTGLTASTLYYLRAYATNSLGTAYGNEFTFTTTFPCGSNFTINHVTGAVAPVNKTVTYGTVTNIPGETSKCWITSNLGADHQATAMNDATEASAGWHWQFNRKQGYKHDGTIRTPNTTWIPSINENLDWVAANDPCTLELGNGWRVPTYIEWYNVNASGTWIEWGGPWNSDLKLHAAGYLGVVDGHLTDRGAYAYYFSGTQGSNTAQGWSLNFWSGACGMYSSVKAAGYSLRCIRD